VGFEEKRSISDIHCEIVRQIASNAKAVKVFILTAFYFLGNCWKGG
jgi:hypothetical protein